MHGLPTLDAVMSNYFFTGLNEVEIDHETIGGVFVVPDQPRLDTCDTVPNRQYFRSGIILKFIEFI